MDELISRQAALDAAIKADMENNGGILSEKRARVFDAHISRVPPAEQTERSIGKLIGYTGEPCPNCGRLRVERYESGLEICEKCNWCEQTKSYWLD